MLSVSALHFREHTRCDLCVECHVNMASCDVISQVDMISQNQEILQFQVGGLQPFRKVNWRFPHLIHFMFDAIIHQFCKYDAER